MIDLDNPQITGMGLILVALLVPIIYGLFVDNHKKGTEDPRTNTH
ncbi:MAG: hypothetical protein R8J85_03540 [Mariprofundales bacterium]